MKLLVVVDMQKDFIDGSLGTKEAVKIVDSVNNKIKNFDGVVIYTRDSHDDNYLNIQEGINLPVVHCKIGTEGHNILSIIDTNKQPSNRDIDFLKNIYDKNSFGSVELATDIKKCFECKLIDEVEFIGLCTDICVLTNVMLVKGMIPEIKITVDSSCCAGVNIESHNAALTVMKCCQINVI